ncbi:HdeD family acid-resistance protein [Chroogloeocystis siderophila]|uniref:HdeD protein n=1 Tax=Chroogloeocystis siderophila 5.2 s.c.1 TaxID=247279 RepID=A0A1U7HUE9_9CHRO|nr:HdeD family acid-resistance protein [Chroogloeocystis siderophila]OKH27155.1 hypothetical protein NIES1031_10650 [Chroogloeocystis siderophila 5.2 s.c.1]
MNADTADEIQQSSSWSIALGVVMVLLGVGAILEPFVATIAVAIALTWFLLIVGIVRIVQAVQSRRQKGFWLKLLVGLFYVLAWILLITNVFGAALTFTLVLGSLILVEGILEVIAAFKVRPDGNWIWLLFSGILSIILSVLILYQWPSSATWLLGVYAGTSFLFTGIWMIMLPLAVRKQIS